MGRVELPADFRGLAVPPVLLSGHHADIEKWRRREALKRTLERRPELVGARDALDPIDRRLLDELLAAAPDGERND